MLSNPFDSLPVSVEIDGVSHPINSDFRFGVSLEMEVLSGEDADVMGLLDAFYPAGIPGNVRAAADKMLEFYRGYVKLLGDKTSKNESKKGRQYDYEQTEVLSQGDRCFEDFLLKFQRGFHSFVQTCFTYGDNVR